MSNYTAAVPNAFDSGLIPIDVREKYFEEYLGLTPLSVFIGTSPEDAIQVFEMLNGDGSSIRVPFRKELNYTNPIVGYDQAAGAEQTTTVYYDQIQINPLRFVDGLQGVPFVRKLTPVDIFDMLRPLLLNAQKRNLIKAVLDYACGLPNVGGAYNPAAQIPSYDRALACGALNGPIATRAQWNNAANINAIVAAMNAGTAYNQNGLNVSHIRMLKTYAISGNAPDVFEAEAKIRPIELKTKRGFPEELYVYLIDPNSYLSLCKDPDWSQFMYRGVIQNGDQPEGISGARYRGMVDGILVYETPELARYRITSGGFQSAWNLLLGAQAFGIAWGERVWFEMERRDFGFNVAMAACEIRGQKMIQFPSYQAANMLPAGLTQIEHGVIHSFARIA